MNTRTGLLDEKFGNGNIDSTPLIITGDMNTRTGLLDEKFDNENIGDENYFKINNNSSMTLPNRNNCNKSVNEQGKTLIEFCRILYLKF